MPSEGTGTADDYGLGLTEAQVEEVREAIGRTRDLFQQMADTVASLDVDGMDLDDFLEARARIGVLYSESNKATGRIGRIFGLPSGQARMLHYLRLHVGEPVQGPQLAGVSAIWEWARRSRELDVEQGWQIVVGTDEDLGLGHNMYMLTSVDRDAHAAQRWQRMNGIRRMKGSGQDRVLRLLKEAYPESVHRRDLDYVAKIGSRDRRKRNLDELGWRISSYEDDPSLPNGYYRLESLEKGPPRAREHMKLRQQILEAADFTCQQCGARPEPGRRVVLHVHHKQFLKHGGNDDPVNLEVLCRPCHAGKHAVAETAVEDELLYPAADPYIT